MSQSQKRSILRWYHLIPSIQCAGDVYSRPVDIKHCAGEVRYLYFPTLVLSGIWMWKGHWVRQFLSRPGT